MLPLSVFYSNPITILDTRHNNPKFPTLWYSNDDSLKINFLVTKLPWETTKGALTSCHRTWSIGIEIIICQTNNHNLLIQANFFSNIDMRTVYEHIIISNLILVVALQILTSVIICRVINYYQYYTIVLGDFQGVDQIRWRKFWIAKKYPGFSHVSLWFPFGKLDISFFIEPLA